MALRESRGIALLFHDLGTRWRWVVSVTPRPPLPPGKTRYPLYRRLGGPQGRSGRVQKISPRGIRSPDLATTEASVFFFIVCPLLSSITSINIISMITNNMNKKLTNIFLISVQLQAHSNSCRLTRKLRTTIYPSDFCRCIL